MHYDPVDGNEIVAGTEYAEKDGLYFGSLQTQQMFYTLVEKGFSVQFVQGKPTLVKQEGTVVWNLMHNGKEGAHFRQKTDGKRVVPGLVTGEYVFKAETPDLYRQSIRGSSSKSVTVTVDVTSG